MATPRMPQSSGKTPWNSREAGGSGKAEPKSARLPRATGNYKRMGSGSGKSEPPGHRLPRAK